MSPLLKNVTNLITSLRYLRLCFAATSKNHFCYNLGIQTNAVYLDFSKTFCRPDHELLFLKFYRCEFFQSLFCLFMVYLHNNKQYVTLNGFNSSECRALFGVLQVSVLGSCLFNTFVNDIIEWGEYLLNIDEVKLLARILEWNE